ncbi:hypothetical protein C1645_349488 [Glomus cerebriforme]|uniref:Uncharacterized protein n=1 Tax=Glomus cerebriforme TaxID=658196 RepID=A0A397STW4_9GLOM|nr:hypothetical protein C1645_349488 [Glomus cerebriforme]
MLTMLNKFCYCIDLKIIACVLGFIGIIQEKILFVIIFAHYYLIAAVLDFLVTIFASVLLVFTSPIDFCRGGRDVDTCITVFINLRILSLLLIAFVDIVQVHFSLAIWSYYKRLQSGDNGRYSLISNDEV